MAVAIHKAVKEDQNALVAEHDLYFDESKEKVLVVEEGQPVPTDAAFVLAMRGSRVPQQHVELVKKLGEAEKARAQPEVKPQIAPEQPVAPVAEVQTESKPAKPESKKQ